MRNFVRVGTVGLCLWGTLWTIAAQAQPPQPAVPAAKSSETALQQVLERLNKVERELEHLKRNPGRLPLDKKDFKLIVGLETPALGVTYHSQTNPRFFAARLLFVNLTDQKIILKSSDIKLDADGQEIVQKEVSPQWQYAAVQIGMRQHQLRELSMPKELHIPVAGNASTWVLFTDLPPGNFIPALKLKVAAGEYRKEIDVNAQQRDVLGLQVERIGPGKCLGLVTVSGMLDSINVGALADEIDRLVGEKTTRVVIRWTDQAPILDHNIYNWLLQTALSLRRQQVPEMQYPSLPVTLRDLNLANVPNDQAKNLLRARQNQSADNSDPQPVFANDVEAVLAALQGAYEVVPRDELTLTIQNGSRLERTAAMIGGGGRLAADKLPLILQAAEDNDPMVQHAALTALSHFGEKEAVDKLVASARKNLPRLSETAVTSLASSRFSAAHEALLAMLQAASPDEKKTIVRLLARYPRPIWSEAIFQFVKDPNSGLGVEALRTLVQVGHPQLLSVLRDALKSSQQPMRNEAFQRLAERTDRESEQLAVDYLLEQLKDNPPTPAAVQLLQRVKDKRALPLLWKQFNRSPNKVLLMQAIAQIGDESTAQELISRYPLLQEHEKGEALRVLSKLDPPQFRKMAGTAMLSGNSLANYAIQGLTEDGGPESIAILADALEKSPQQHVWAMVCNSLMMLGSSKGRAALVKARDSGIPDKRNLAINALEQLQQRSPGFQYVRQAKGLMEQKKFKEALEQFDLAILMDSTLSDAYAERGNLQLHFEKFDLAGKDFQKCFDLDPFNHQGLTGLCIVMVAKEGQHVEAIKKVEDSRAQFGENPIFRYNVACVYSRACEYLQRHPEAAGRDDLLKKYTAAALDELRASVKGGFQDLNWMKNDPDLKSLQENPDFKKLTTTPLTQENRMEQPGRRRTLNGMLKR